MMQTIRGRETSVGWFKKKPDPKIARLEETLATVMGLALKTSYAADEYIMANADTAADLHASEQFRHIREMLCDIADCTDIPVAAEMRRRPARRDRS